MKVLASAVTFVLMLAVAGCGKKAEVAAVDPVESVREEREEPEESADADVKEPEEPADADMADMEEPEEPAEKAITLEEQQDLCKQRAKANKELVPKLKELMNKFDITYSEMAYACRLVSADTVIEWMNEGDSWEDIVAMAERASGDYILE